MAILAAIILLIKDDHERTVMYCKVPYNPRELVPIHLNGKFGEWVQVCLETDAL